MTKTDKIYRIVSIFSFVLHSCLFMFIVAAGFLPFCENQNYYQVFDGFFGKVLSQLHPILMLLLLLVACLLSYFAIKRPDFSFWVGVLVFLFFVLVTFSYSFEAALGSFLSLVGEIGISNYQIGFKLISAASYVTYFDIAFFIYSFITLIIRGVKTSKY